MFYFADTAIPKVLQMNDGSGTICVIPSPWRAYVMPPLRSRCRRLCLWTTFTADVRCRVAPGAPCANRCWFGPLMKKVADALLLSYRPRTGRPRSCTSSPSALRDSTTELLSGLESGCWESDPRLRTIEDDCGHAGGIRLPALHVRICWRMLMSCCMTAKWRTGTDLNR